MKILDHFSLICQEYLQCSLKNSFLILYSCSLFIELHLYFLNSLKFLHDNKYLIHSLFSALDCLEILIIFIFISLPSIHIIPLLHKKYFQLIYQILFFLNALIASLIILACLWDLYICLYDLSNRFFDAQLNNMLVLHNSHI